MVLISDPSKEITQHTCTIYALREYTDTGVVLSKNKLYHLKSEGTWKDGHIECDSTGFNRFYLYPFKFLTRCPKANWGCLLGSIDKNKYFIIGSHTLYSYQSGSALNTLYCCANDVPGFYFNNSGSIRLTITELQ